MAFLAHGSSGRPHIFLYTYLRGVSLSLGALFFNIKFIIVVVHAIVQILLSYFILLLSLHRLEPKFHSSLCSNIGALLHLLDNLLKFYTLFIFVNNYCCLCISIVDVHVLYAHCFDWLLDTRNIVIIIIIIRGKLKITSFVLTTNGRPGWQLNLTTHTTIVDSTAKLFYLFKYTHTQISRVLISQN